MNIKESYNEIKTDHATCVIKIIAILYGLTDECFIETI